MRPGELRGAGEEGCRGKGPGAALDRKPGRGAVLRLPPLMTGTGEQRHRPTCKTNLMLACEQGRTLEVKIILQKKPLTVASRDRNGKTALHYCAESGSLACAQLVVAAEPALLDAQDEDGLTPLHLAIIAGNRSVAKLFLKQGADPDRLDKERHSTIHWAAVCGDTESLDLLLIHGANPSLPDILGAYPIHYAAQMCGAHSLNGKDPETGLGALKKLVKGGASVQCRDRDGREPMLWAASTGSSEAVLILFTAGANVASTDKDGLTALHCAASRGHRGCVETLVTLCGARVNAGDTIGCSPLFYAAAQGHADTVQVLLKYGADPNLQDNKGRTPAHCAAAKGQLEIMRILDSNGSDLWMRNSRGNLPLHESVQSGRKDLVQWLLQQCPRAVNATNINGRTPLHIAAQRNNVEMCEILIDYGAFVNPLMVNVKGFLMSPLDAAVYQGNQRCAKYLQLHGAVPATKVLENNEINKNLLFSLGNYAFSQKERSDEDIGTATTFDHARIPTTDRTEEGGLLVRDTQTRTIRAQPAPLPQPEAPSESLLTNVTSEEVTDTSVHIHLSRDDLWSLWESLMQELTSEMSEDRDGSEASLPSGASDGKHQQRRKAASEIKQLKPILTNVYLRTSRSHQGVIAGESLMDRGKIPRESEERVRLQDDVKKHPRANADHFDESLSRALQEESFDNQTEGNTASSHFSDTDKERLQISSNKGQTRRMDLTDSVGSDTEHRSGALSGVKVTRLRKKKSDGRAWGREPEESETSSGRPEQREANPYLKRYFQKQAKAAELRNYLEANTDRDQYGMPENRDMCRSHQNLMDLRENQEDRTQEIGKHIHHYHHLENGSEEEYEEDGEKHISTLDAEKKSRKAEKYGRADIDDDVHEDLNEDAKRNRRRSSIKYYDNCHRIHHRRHSKEHHDIKYVCSDCAKASIDGAERKRKNSESHGADIRKEQYSHLSDDKEHNSSPEVQLRRTSSKQFLEVPSQQVVSKSRSHSEDREKDIDEGGAKSRHHHRHHHRHRRHHHHHHHHLKDESVLEDHHSHRKHRRYHHRKRSRYATDDFESVPERKNLSDGEFRLGKESMYSSPDDHRSKSEMSTLPQNIIEDSEMVPLISKKSKDALNDESAPKDEYQERKDEKTDSSKELKKKSHTEESAKNNASEDETEISQKVTKENEKDKGTEPDKTDNKIDHTKSKKTSPERKKRIAPHSSLKVAPKKEKVQIPLKLTKSLSAIGRKSKEDASKHKSNSAKEEKNPELPKIKVSSVEEDIKTPENDHQSSNKSKTTKEDKSIRNQQMLQVKTENKKAKEVDKATEGKIEDRSIEKTTADFENLKDALNESCNNKKEQDVSDDKQTVKESLRNAVFKKDDTEKNHDSLKSNDIQSNQSKLDETKNELINQKLNKDLNRKEEIQQSDQKQPTTSKESVSTKSKKIPLQVDNSHEISNIETNNKLASKEAIVNVEDTSRISPEREAKDFLENKDLPKISQEDEIQSQSENERIEIGIATEEAVKNEVQNIMSKAESEYQKMMENMDENSDICSLQEDDSKVEAESLKPHVTFMQDEEQAFVIHNQEDDGKNDVDPDIDEFSEPESTSEAETKFSADDSDDVQPKPDLVDLHLLTGEQEEADILVTEDVKNKPPLETEKTIKSSRLGVTEIHPEKSEISKNDIEKSGQLLMPSVAIASLAEQSLNTEVQQTPRKKAHEKIKQSIEVPKMTKEGLQISNKKLLDEINQNTQAQNKLIDKDTVSKKKVKSETKQPKLVLSAEIQTDFNEEIEPESKDINRSISVQTIDYDLAKAGHSEKANNNSKTISIQTEINKELRKLTKDPDGDIKNLIRKANDNDIAGLNKAQSLIKESEKDLSSLKTDSIKAEKSKIEKSPERQNPSAVFYNTKIIQSNERSVEQKEEVPSTQNRGAVFYVAPRVPKEEPKKKVKQFFRSGSLENARSAILKQEERNNKLSSRRNSRDRSLESERAVAIANSAYRTLTAKGELTVFNSSLKTGSNEVSLSETLANLENSAKLMSHRRGETSNLEKPGFLWVHFGSGSSPVSSLKRRPNLTSQRTKKESSLAAKERNTPRGNFSKNEKNAVPKRDSIPSTRQKLPLTEKDKGKVNAQTGKNHAKTDESLIQKPSQTDPALQVSSKILTNKKVGKKTEINKDFQKKLVGKNDEKDINQKSKAPVQKEAKGVPKSETTKSLQKLSPEKHPKKTPNTQNKKTDGKNLDNKISSSDAAKKTVAHLKKTDAKTDSSTIAVDPQNLAPASKINETGSGNFPSKNNNNNQKENKSQKENNSQKQNESQDFNDLKKDLNDLGDDQPKKPNNRLIETAKSSSLDEGDVRLTIERKRDPEISIKISMKDRYKKKAQKKESFTTDISSTQGESDYSLMKDSGYISTSESVHNHRRSITIDLGHTTAKINAGMRNMTETSSDSLNFTEEDNAKDALTDSNVVLPLVSTGSNQQKCEEKTRNSPRVTASSKLPILSTQRQRSNSMILMEYHRSPRRNSLSKCEPLSETELPKSAHIPKSARSGVHIGRSFIPRQIGGNIASKRRKSNIPIYRTHSDSNLHKEKISPRLKGLSSSTPSIHEELERRKFYSERKMDILREQSSSTEAKPEIEEHYRNIDTLKLPSICLTKPDEKAMKLQVGHSQFPEIAKTPRDASPRKETAPSRASSILSFESVDLKLPILQQPIRCKCSIEPHKYWDARRAKSAIDCVANLHFLSEEEIAQFDSRFLALSGRSSYSGGMRKRLTKKPIGYKALRTQTLKRLSTGKLMRKSQQAVTFHVDHNKERNTFQLPTEKLQQNKKWQVVFTIGKSGKENKKTEVDDNK